MYYMMNYVRNAMSMCIRPRASVVSPWTKPARPMGDAALVQEVESCDPLLALGTRAKKCCITAPKQQHWAIARPLDCLPMRRYGLCARVWSVKALCLWQVTLACTGGLFTKPYYVFLHILHLSNPKLEFCLRWEKNPKFELISSIAKYLEKLLR